jgi:hypothetical protein
MKSLWGHKWYIGFPAVVCMVLLLSGCHLNVLPDVDKKTELDPVSTEVSMGSAQTATEEINTEEQSTAAPVINEEYEPYTVGEDSLFAEVPVYSYDKFVEHRNMGGAEMLMFSRALTEEGYLEYGERLEAAGFACYAENEIEENLFTTWVRDELVLTAIYMNDYTKVHLIAEKTDDLPGLIDENFYEDLGIENLVVQISADFDGETRNGMCYVYRLCDGSFIIVDSAFYREECADAIYETLYRLAPDPDKIVIAAWFLTHAHGDHIGGFQAFAEKYADLVQLERVIYNYPAVKDFLDCDVTTNHIKNTQKACAHYEELEVIEAHPGQKFYIRDAEIEMLFTWELLVDKVDYFNDTSLVFSIKLGDELIMQLGDCGPETAQVILYLYGKYLKSDIVQVAHHGYQGASALLYRRIDADVALWPSTGYNYLRQEGRKDNQPLKDVEAMYLAERLVTVIPLPYDGEDIQTWNAYED